MPTVSANDPLDEAFDRILKQVIKASHCQAGGDSVRNALLFLLLRCANTWKSIRTLRVHSSDDQTFTIDAAVLLRCIFDAYLQANLIYRDQGMRAERAQDYLEFAHVDRYRAEQK